MDSRRNKLRTNCISMFHVISCFGDSMITCSLAESIDIQGGPKKWSHKSCPQFYQILILTWLLTTPPHVKYYVSTLPCNLSLMVCYADINVSQGSVATYSRCGGIFNIQLTANLARKYPVNFLHSFISPQNGSKNRIETGLNLTKSVKI